MAKGVVGLLLVVHLSSEPTVEPVREVSSLAEKQESHAAIPLIVRGESAENARNRFSVLWRSGSLMSVIPGCWWCVERSSSMSHGR
jgi:hypothetical protein